MMSTVGSERNKKEEELMSPEGLRNMTRLSYKSAEAK